MLFDQWFQLRCKPFLEYLHSLKKSMYSWDWHTILVCKGKLVNNAMLCSNKKCINLDYQIGQKVLKYDITLQGKLKPKPTGLFDILWVHTNGNLKTHLHPGISEWQCLLHLSISGAHTNVILFGIHVSSSSITRRERVMPSCTSHMIPRIPLLYRFLFLLLWFFVMSCTNNMHVPLCPPLVLSLCALHALPSSKPTFSLKIPLIKTGYFNRSGSGSRKKNWH